MPTNGFDSGLTGKPSTRREEQADERREILLAALAYVPVLMLVPLVISGSTEFLGFHKRQGFMLFLAEIGAAMLWFLPHAGHVVCPALLLAIGAMILRALNSVGRHTTWEAPVLGAAARWLNL